MDVPEVNTGIEAINHTVSGILTSEIPQANVNPLQIWILICSQIWLLGFAVLLATALIGLLRLKKQLQDAALCQDNIFISSKIDTAFVMGIICPKIYLPSILSDAEQNYILLHERTHIRRLDLITVYNWHKELAVLVFYLYIPITPKS
ncbi:M56 family metallopeptidase [Lacrimispora amygdalina]|uniref:M56 family metallopeptidase n=1 Tax=Lacrimispora amygdalina TaxID=253257 RepID=UPI000BE40AE8|nr:M56 family metallopeptidase [Lacrimispora amygdalina]